MNAKPTKEREGEGRSYCCILTETGMGVFSESPNFFKIDRSTPFASKLKSSISQKLLEFLGNYTDDVLAEYITVLVCNGKHQKQAIEDLEAFLGKRSAEFVTWLWDLLFYRLSASKDATVSAIRDRKVCRTNRLTESQNHGTGSADSSPVICVRDEKLYHVSTHACNSIISNVMEICEDCPVDEVNTKKAPSQASEKEIITRVVDGGENIGDDSLTYKPSRMGGLSESPAAGGDESIQQMDTFKKIVNSGREVLPNKLSHFSKGDPLSRNMPSLISGTILDNLQPRKPYEANAFLKAVGAVSSNKDKSRRSVWDRLGKPCEDVKTVDAPQGVSNIQKSEQVHVVLVSPSKDKFDSERHAVKKNIMRKRNFGEIGTGPGSHSVSLVAEMMASSHKKEYSRDSKRLNLAVQAASEPRTSALVSRYSLRFTAKSESKKIDMTQLGNTKERLCQIEMEMSKLRSKQAEMQKDGKSISLSSISALKHPEEDSESRSVFVTNVHFAATKEDLLLLFAQCGVIIGVHILTDLVTAQPKGCAYITFSSKESVDKAVELSGTLFFSRSIKVSRKVEMTTQVASGMPSRAAPFCQKKRKSLQWRRKESVPEASSVLTQNEE